MDLSLHCDIFTSDVKSSILEAFILVNDPATILHDVREAGTLSTFEKDPQRVYFCVEMCRDGKFNVLSLCGDGKRLRYASDSEKTEVELYVEKNRDIIVARFSQTLIDSLEKDDHLERKNLIHVYQETARRVEKRALLPVALEVFLSDFKPRSTHQLIGRIAESFKSQSFTSSLEEFFSDVDKIEVVGSIDDVSNLISLSSKYINIEFVPILFDPESIFRFRLFSKFKSEGDGGHVCETQGPLILDFSLTAEQANTLLGLEKWCAFFGLDHKIDHFIPRSALISVEIPSIAGTIDVFMEAYVQPQT